MNDAGAQRGSTYPYAYRVLHAAIALIVLTLFAMQYVRKPFGDEVNDTVRELHKSLGLVLLVLIVLRIVLRSRMAGPRPFPDPSRFREVTAKLVHKALWVLMILVPVLGVTFLLARGRGVDFFGLATLGPVTSGSPYWGPLSLVVHRTAAFVLISFVAVHAAAALMHGFVLRDGLLARMSLRHGTSEAAAPKSDGAVIPGHRGSP